MAKQFVDIVGLRTFFARLKDAFATQEDVASVEIYTNTYILDVDYSVLEFDTSEIVS
jgi:hypothetical protein